MQFILLYLLEGCKDGAQKWEKMYASEKLQDTLSALYNELLRLNDPVFRKTVHRTSNLPMEYQKLVGITHYFRIVKDEGNIETVLINADVHVWDEADKLSGISQKSTNA